MDSRTFDFVSEPSVWLLASRGEEVLGLLVSGSACSGFFHRLYSYFCRNWVVLHYISGSGKRIFHRAVPWW